LCGAIAESVRFVDETIGNRLVRYRYVRTTYGNELAIVVQDETSDASREPLGQSATPCVNRHACHRGGCYAYLVTDKMRASSAA